MLEQEILLSQLQEEERTERMEKILNVIEGCMDEELTRFERIIMERRGRAAAHSIVAPIGTTQTSKLRCLAISFDVRFCSEGITEGLS